MMQLTDFPESLVIQVFTHLDLQALVSCKRVCSFIIQVNSKQWRLRLIQVCRFFNEITQSATLQYKLELAACGQEDGPNRTLGAADRLQKLLLSSNAWRDIDSSIKNAYVSSVNLHPGRPWALRGGVLAVVGASGRDIQFRQLPSRYRELEERESVVSDVGFVITQLHIDPVQDLLILIEERRCAPLMFLAVSPSV